MWVEPVELARSGITRTVAQLQDADVVVLESQELVGGEWRACGALALSRAAIERLIVAVGFR